MEQEEKTVRRVVPGMGVRPGSDLPHGDIVEGETVDLPARPLSMTAAEGIDTYLQHLDDACPIITYDEVEAKEIRARYIVGEEIGSGSIGQVIEARDAHLSRSIAVKVLHGGPGVSKDRIARFIAEAQITAQLEHPHIVPVHEIGQMPGGMPYFAMKRVRGESLDDIINHLRVGDDNYQRFRNGKAVARIFFRICQGVAYAHAKGVIHRDLKPANILIGEFGVVQVMDWGLAKVLGASEFPEFESVQTVRAAPDLDTLDGAIAGTPSYMSPEQARGEVERVGPCSDIYSLGLILAEMLTLVRVFRDSGSESTLSQVRNAGSVDVFALAPNARIDPELAAVVRKCTAPDQARRYRHAGELAEELRKYLEDREIDVHQDLSHRKVVKWSRRNPMLAGALLTAGAVAGAHFLYWSWLRWLFA